MRRGALQFALLVLPGAALAVATSLSAAACYGQQDQQSQPPAQQPQDTTPSRPTSSPDSSQESSSKKAVLPDDPAPAAAPAATPADAKKKSKPGVLPPEDDKLWDPFHAQQDIDVGMFYLHKGDVDAAISRFEDAIRLRADFAKPRILLAECYEKKGDPSEAVRYYKEYLQVLPNAPDAKKVQQKIEKLSKK
jgi:Flp pilus assembly protein TadD